MRWSCCAWALVLVLFLGVRICPAQVVQRVEIPSSPNPVGSGARALGMGGAFIAVADDATAASWNPGGLVQLETPEISAVGAYFHRVEEDRFSAHPEASGSHGVSKVDLNYLSGSYPFTLFRRNMVFSVNWQRLYDFNRDLDFPFSMSAEGLLVEQRVASEQKGGLSAIGIAYGLQILPRLSMGITLNIWQPFAGENRWDQETLQQGTGVLYVPQQGGVPSEEPFTFQLRSSESTSLSGINVNVGMLWRVHDKLALGAVYKSPFRASLERETWGESDLHYPGHPEADQSDRFHLVEEETLDLPMSYGLGAACRLSDRFSLSLDVYRTEWGDFILRDGQGNRISPVTGRQASRSDVGATNQVRLGAEFLFVGRKVVVPLRAGFFYDPAPADGAPDNYFGGTLGSGLAVGRLVLDCAYQFRFGHEVGTSSLPHLGLSQEVREHTFYWSLIYHFE